MMFALNKELAAHDWRHISRFYYQEDGQKKATLLSYLLSGKAPWTFLLLTIALLASEKPAEWYNHPYLPYLSPGWSWSIFGATAFCVSGLMRSVLAVEYKIVYSVRRPDKDVVALVICIALAIGILASGYDWRMALLFPFQYLFCIACARAFMGSWISSHEFWWRSIGAVVVAILLLAAYAVF